MSLIADHCIYYSLSDPQDARFQEKCENMPQNPHNHNHKCSRCHQLRDTFGDVRSLVAGFINDARESENELKLKRFEEVEAELHNAETKIINMKRHIVRSIASDIRREDLIKNLNTGTTFITMDWGMKWIPRKARETTIDWYGKKGISYHVSHIIANLENKGQRQHTFVHIFAADEKQDSEHVTAILLDVIRGLSEMAVSNVILRSDNAGK